MGGADTAAVPCGTGSPSTAPSSQASRADQRRLPLLPEVSTEVDDGGEATTPRTTTAWEGRQVRVRRQAALTPSLASSSSPGPLLADAGEGEAEDSSGAPVVRRSHAQAPPASVPPHTTLQAAAAGGA